MSNTNKTPELNQDMANQMLKNIFESCDVAPNTIPTEDLESYTEYREDRFKAKKVIILIILAVFLCLPLLFLAPSISNVDQKAAGLFPKYQVKVDSLLPISSVTAAVDKQKVNVYEVKPKVYSVEPDTAGSMVIKVKTINGQYTTLKVDVAAIDKEAPRVVKDKTTKKSLTLYLEDNGSGVDYESIIAMNTAGDRIEPSGYDADENWVSFDFPKSAINIFVSDKAGNTLQLAVTLK